MALALVVTARKLRPYFLSHPIIVLTNSPLGRIMTHSEVSGRMIKWNVELGEYDIEYKPRVAIKAQALSDFLSEMIQPAAEERWRVFVDGASCLAGCGVGVVIISPSGEKIKLAVKIDSRVTNNEAEYEAVLAGIRATREIGAARIILYSDSQLITQQIKGAYEVKDDRMLKYLHLIKAQAEVFVDWSIEQIPREENGEADALAKMAASLSEDRTREVLFISLVVLAIEEEEMLPVPEDSWMVPLIKFIRNGELPEEKARAQKIKRQPPRFVLLNNVLYRRSFQGPLLKCLSGKEVIYVLREIHEGCCGEHLGGTSLARKAMLAGFWWPTLHHDSARVVRTCEGCQHHSNFQHSPATPMKPIWASCPFDQWGMDIVGPFPVAQAQKKFLLVAVDYFSKWVEAEALAKITEREVLKFLWKNIVCRFGVPRRLISDNGRIIVQALKARLQGKGKDWVEELPSVLWAYRTTPRASTQETPFSLVYGSEAILPVEIGQTSARVESYPINNEDSRAVELDLLEEKRDQAMIRMEAYRVRVMKSYNKKVRVRDLQIGDLVMKKVNPAGDVGKLEARWEGPYKIIRRVSSGSFYLEDAQGKLLRRP
ncbi:uncharacterized protein [Primulina eburnea]|uniref:uncharacterized protein n=1 Tax=Primulina eburnea TaxID=1245227 RepID=UPI003C6C967C